MAEMNLSKNFYNEEGLNTGATREGFGAGLLELGKKNPQVVALTADVGGSTKVSDFAAAYPERFVQVGVAEQNLVTVASGLAAEGKIPFAAAFGAFSPGRNWEQIRTTICYNNVPVHVVATHTGLSVGEDGATHQILEDIALMRSLPNMTVVIPADYEQAYKATLAVAKHNAPTYMRLSRASFPKFTTARTPFVLGKADVYRSGKDVTLLATGTQVYEALMAAEMVRDVLSVEVINVHTIKPLDSATILRSARKTGLVVTAEDHQINAGLGGAVAELLSEQLPTRLVRVGVQDRFGESGPDVALWKKYGIDRTGIARVLKAAAKKK